MMGVGGQTDDGERRREEEYRYENIADTKTDPVFGFTRLNG
ncbi:MAG: hypothetical protein SCALA701_32160 [Candidatus Scalindua sp.]|nr:MAG: hypothetical protein SCALA701_32160 [Candidatus Scalindua sp.]